MAEDRFRATGEFVAPEGRFDTAAYIRALTVESMMLDIERGVVRGGSASA